MLVFFTSLNGTLEVLQDKNDAVSFVKQDRWVLYVWPQGKGWYRVPKKLLWPVGKLVVEGYAAHSYHIGSDEFKSITHILNSNICYS